MYIQPWRSERLPPCKLFSASEALLETAADLVPQLEQTTANKQAMKNSGGFRLIVVSSENGRENWQFAWSSPLGRIEGVKANCQFALPSRCAFHSFRALQRDMQAPRYFFSLARK